MPILRAALVIMTGNVASRLLGVVREIVVAWLFGATAATDAFRAASRIPTSIYDLLVGGMISAALVPVLSDFADDEDQAQFWLLASMLGNLVVLMLLPVALVLMLFAPQVMRLYAGGLDPQTEALAVEMLRIMLPALVFQGLAGLFIALHYAKQQFTAPAVSVSAFNLGIIVAALVLSGTFGIVSLVIGVLAGAIFQSGLLFFTLRRRRYYARLDLRSPALRRIGRLYLPVAVGLFVSQIGVLVDTNLATGTGEGNLAAMIFATTLVQFPLGLIAAAVSFAVLPTLSRAAPDAQGVGAIEEPAERERQFRATLGLGLKLVLIAIVPATVALVLLRYPVIQILFQRGNFDVLATEKTALAFLAYAPGLVAAALDQVLIFAFYARRQTLTPVLVGVMSIGVYLVFAFALVEPLGFAGLALANSAQWISHALVLGVLLWREMGGPHGMNLGPVSVKVLAAAVVMSLVLGFLAGWAGLTGPSSIGLVPLILVTLALSAAGAAVYVGTLWALRVRELVTLGEMVRARTLGRWLDR